jgi:hypothetical protein
MAFSPMLPYVLRPDRFCRRFGVLPSKFLAVLSAGRLVKTYITWIVDISSRSQGQFYDECPF